MSTIDPTLRKIAYIHETSNVWEMAELLKRGWRVLVVTTSDPAWRPVFALGTETTIPPCGRHPHGRWA